MLLVLLAACAPNRVQGLIAGQPVPIESAHLTVETGAFGDDDLVVVTMSSLPGSCSREQYWRELSANADTPEALAQAWADAWPAEFWQVDLVARVAGGSWPPRDSVWTGLAWDAFPEEPGQVFATFDHHVAWRDATWFAGEFEDEDVYEHVFYSDLGAVQWGKGLPAQKLAGKMSTNTTDGSGTFTGRVELRFDVVTCPVVATVDPTTY